MHGCVMRRIATKGINLQDVLNVCVNLHGVFQAHQNVSTGVGSVLFHMKLLKRI